MTEFVIRALEPSDWDAIEQIYRDGIATGHATFEEHPPTWEDFDAGKAADCRLVAAGPAGAVWGWAAGTPVSKRPAYRGVIEISLYVAAAARGKGAGGALMAAFLEAADAAGYWTVQSSVFPENVASIAMHERVGYRVVGRRERIGLMTYGPLAGTWRDTVILERRRL